MNYIYLQVNKTGEIFYGRHKNTLLAIGAKESKKAVRATLMIV